MLYPCPHPARETRTGNLQHIVFIEPLLILQRFFLSFPLSSVGTISALVYALSRGVGDETYTDPGTPKKLLHGSSYPSDPQY